MKKYFPKEIFEWKKVHNPHWSTLICFCCAIASEPGINRATMRRNFNKLVNPGDYHKSEKEQVFNWLWEEYKSGNLSKK